MGYTLLEKIANSHAVTGDTDERSNFICTELKKLKIDFHEDKFGSILVGDPDKAKVMVAAHMDEVGFQVIDINQNGTLRILPVGWVFANRLDHACVYVHTGKGRIRGAIFHSSVLKSENIETFADIVCDVGAKSKQDAHAMGIKPGQTGTFCKDFWEQGDKVFAASLDNTISIFTALQLLAKDKSILKDVAFAFHTDEEMQDHSANSLAYQFQPEYVVILDYCPVHHKQDAADAIPVDQGPFAIYRAGAHIIHPRLREIIDKLDFPKAFISAHTLPSVEPQNFQNNGVTKAVNFCIPAQGYHGGVYAAKKVDIDLFQTRLLELVKTLLGELGQ